MSPRRLDFIEWLKCLGILVIVYGHVGARTIDWFFSPIYPKQLGVALFVFAVGYSLAQERRSPWRVVYNRLFELYLFAFLFALLMSGVTLGTRGTAALSNYEPLVLGVSVAFDAFPANPTMWYIGTYLHILLLWAVFLRHFRTRVWMVALWALCEIGIRMVLVAKVGQYVAYMAAPNWGTVFLLGTLFGQKSVGDIKRAGGLAWLGVLGFLTLWYVALPAPLQLTFPFKRLGVGDPIIDWLTTSTAVTILYSSSTWLIFEAARRTAAPAWVRLVARNTIVVFIAHMPLYYGLQMVLVAHHVVYSVRLTIELFVCIVGLVLVSEGMRRLIEPVRLREMIAERLGSSTRLTKWFPQVRTSDIQVR